jgi:hypothetical protein
VIIDEAKDIAGGDTEELAAAEGTQGADGGLRIIVSGDRSARLRDECLEAARHELAIVREERDGIG